MNKAFIDGFIKAAEELGLSTAEAKQLMKSALDIDPAALEAAGAPGVDAGGVPDAGLGAALSVGDASDPNAAADAGGDELPPELEQLIQSLPPETLQQLLAEIQAELQQSEAGAVGVDPNAIVAKQAEYVEGFFKAAEEYGFDEKTAAELYNTALDIMGVAPEGYPIPNEKLASHYEGFVEQGKSYGLTKAEIDSIYSQLFS